MRDTIFDLIIDHPDTALYWIALVISVLALAISACTFWQLWRARP